MDTEYIYLLQEREFINSKQPIYKIGKTKQENHKRFEQYPKGSILLFQIICSDCDCYEKKILYIFNHKFKKRPDIGREYFEGDYKTMINYIYNIVYLYDGSCDESCDEEVQKCRLMRQEIYVEEIQKPKYKEEIIQKPKYKEEIIQKPKYKEEIIQKPKYKEAGYFHYDSVRKEWRENCSVRKENYSELFKCDKCNMQYTSKETLIKHYFIHIEENI